MVYIDSMNAKYGRMKMCHMVADTHEELIAMANNIGIQLKWLQYAGTYKEHFDVCAAKKAKAIEFGAKEVSTRDLIKIKQPKELTTLTNP